MKPAIRHPRSIDEPGNEPSEGSGDEPVTRAPRMGSEYATARTYLARRAALPVDVPEHGSNDSDFVGRDPLPD